MDLNGYNMAIDRFGATGNQNRLAGEPSTPHPSHVLRWLPRGWAAFFRGSSVESRRGWQKMAVLAKLCRSIELTAFLVEGATNHGYRIHGLLY